MLPRRACFADADRADDILICSQRVGAESLCVMQLDEYAKALKGKRHFKDERV
jgi:hypothetical protein